MNAEMNWTCLYCTPEAQGRLDALDDGGCSHAATCTHGDEASCLVLTLKFVDQGANQHCACCTNGVSKRHGSTVDVHL